MEQLKVLLISGGTDSISLLRTVKPDLAVTVDYGQKPFVSEYEVSKFFCARESVPHDLIILPVQVSETSSLISGKPSDSDYLPLRNQMLLSCVIAKYLQRGISEIVLGVVEDDKHYPDCTGRFIKSYNNLLKLQNIHVHVSAPGIKKTASDLLEAANYSYEEAVGTFSCHVSDIPCGVCRGCWKRRVTLFRVFDST